MLNCTLFVQLLQNCSYTAERIELKFVIVTTPQLFNQALLVNFSLSLSLCVCVCVFVLKAHCGDLLRTSVLVCLSCRRDFSKNAKNHIQNQTPLKVLFFEGQHSHSFNKKCFSYYSQQSSIIKYPKKSLQPSKNQFKVFINILAGRLIFLYIIAYFEY